MKRNIILVVSMVFIMFFGFQSCKTDVDINADFKEIPIVYCVLDPSQEYQFVKLNKAFLGKKDVAEMAQTSDSLFFKDNVSVTLRKLQNDKEVAYWTFDYCDSIKKQEGFFANDKNILYIKKVNFGNYDKGTVFEVLINVGDGKHIVRGKAKLIDNMGIYRPSEFMPNISLIAKNGFECEYRAGNAACITEVLLKLNYLEVVERDTSYKSLYYNIYDGVLSENYNNDIVKSKIDVVGFYQHVANTLTSISGMQRFVKMPNSCELVIKSAEENYYIYTQVTSPSTGIIQFRPTYTNLESETNTECMGLVASRNSFSQTYMLSQQTLDSLYRGIYTKSLGFASPFNPYYAPYFIEK